MLLKPLERISASSIQNFEDTFALGSRPVIITDTAVHWPVVKAGTFRDLAARFGHVKVPVRESDNEFLEFFGAKDTGANARKIMTLAAYIELVHGSITLGTRPPYAANISILNDRAVANKLDGLLSECNFPDWLPQSSKDEYRLWIGAAGQRSTIHNDPYHNFNAQIIGRKHFMLFSPQQHPAVYPEFFNNWLWASRIDPLNPDIDKYPNFKGVEGFECELLEGEILYLPMFWWHCAKAKTPSVNINRWVYTQPVGQEYWHQQPIAKPFISHKQLLDQISNKFDSMPKDLQEYWRKEFSALKADMIRLIG